MNFWQFLIVCGHRLDSYGTRLLGIAQGTVALIATMDNIIPATQLKYWLAGSAILTFWRGSANADKIAAKVVERTSLTSGDSR